MMSGMRAFVKSPLAGLLLLLLVVSFGIFGFSDPFRGVVGGGFVRAGDRSVGARDVSRSLDQYLKRVQREQGQTVSPKEAAAQGVVQAIVNELTQRTMTLAYADKVGIKAAPTEVAKMMIRIFPDGLGGVSKEIYQTQLRELSMQPREFERELRDELTYDYLQRGLLAGLEPPALMYNPVVEFLGEKRTVAFGRFAKGAVPTPPAPTDADLQAFYKERSAMFAQPERRRISAVMYSPEDFVGKVEVSDKQVSDEYERRKKEFSGPEARTLAQFTAKDRNAIQTVVDTVKQGKTLEEAVAATPGVTLATITVKPTDITNETYRNNAFAMPLNETFGPMDVDGAFLGVQVKAITPGEVQPLSQVAGQLRDELRKKEARRLYDATSETFHDLVGSGASLEEIADEVGAPVISFAAVDQRGLMRGARMPAPLSKYPEQLQALFKLDAGAVGDAVEGDNERAVMRVDEIVKAYTPAFEEVKADLKPIYMASKELEAAKKMAEGAVTAIKAGKSVDAAAAAARLTLVRPPTPISRGEQTQIDPAVLETAFSLKEGEAGVATAQSGEPWLVQVSKIEKVKAADAPQLAQQVQGGYHQSVAQDILTAFSREVRKTVSHKINDGAVQRFLASYNEEQTP